MDGPWQEHKENVKNLQADLNVESNEALPSLSEDAGTDITHVEKRHKIDHESSGSLFQVPAALRVNLLTTSVSYIPMDIQASLHILISRSRQQRLELHRHSQFHIRWTEA